MDEESLNWPVTVTLFAGERYSGRWMPESLIEAVGWLRDILDEVPPEYRNSATIEIDSVSSWESDHYPSITISYARPPTEAEKQERIAEERQRNEARLNEARQQYEWLKARFEPEGASAAKDIADTIKALAKDTPEG